MRVVYANQVIAAGDAESPDGLHLVQTRGVQLADYIRADYGATLDRANWRHELTFAVTRQHDDIRRATIYILDHPDTLPGSGTLLLEQRETAGVARRWSADAVLTRVELITQIGVSTRWGYSFVLGEIRKTNPDIAP